MYMKSFKVSERVFVVEGENKGRYPFCNCLFIDDTEDCLVDSGAGAKKLMKLGTERIDYLINSHFHEDHTRCNVLFKNTEICCHIYDAEAVESIEELKRRYGPPNSQMYSLTSYFLAMLDYRPSEVSVRFKDNDEFSFRTVKLRVIHTSGHSIGHCCFLIDDLGKRIIHLSDIDLTAFGPWYGCLDCDIDMFINSINTLIEMVETTNIQVATSSHEKVIAGKEEIKIRLENYLSKIFDREQKILGLLKVERSIGDLVGKGLIYSKFGEPELVYMIFEEIMLEKHIQRLLKSGLVENTNGKFKAES